MMSCLLLFNFILLLLSITLLILGVTTSRWLVFVDDNTTDITSERSNGIISSCQRLYRQGNMDQYSTINNLTTSSSNSIYDDAYVCYNRLLKWHNASIIGPDLLGKLKKPLNCSIMNRIVFNTNKLYREIYLIVFMQNLLIKHITIDELHIKIIRIILFNNRNLVR
jgi:hypothetical protein